MPRLLEETSIAIIFKAQMNWNYFPSETWDKIIEFEESCKKNITLNEASEK